MHIWLWTQFHQFPNLKNKSPFNWGKLRSFLLQKNKNNYLWNRWVSTGRRALISALPLKIPSRYTHRRWTSIHTSNTSWMRFNFSSHWRASSSKTWGKMAVLEITYHNFLIYLLFRENPRHFRFWKAVACLLCSYSRLRYSQFWNLKKNTYIKKRNIMHSLIFEQKP